MKIEALLQYRDELLANSTSEDGFLSETNVLEVILPELVDCKLIDSEDVNLSFFEDSNIGKLNAYAINESGERLQVFIVNGNSIKLSTKKENLLLSKKSEYERHFALGISLIKKAIKGYLTEELQESSSLTLLNSKLNSSDFLNQIDVIEFILISPTLTVETRGAELSFKKIEFEDSEIDINLTINNDSRKKKVTIIKRLVDLNYLYDVRVSKSGAYALKVDFETYFDRKIEVLKAADENNFESYLCVLPATGMAKLYKRESSGLLEKNVRSFLQFRGVNKGMKETIRDFPEKFIAFNNGLTITAIDKEICQEGDRIFIKSLTDFQIVNGGQTTASIFFANKEGLDISKINLMAKINIAKNVTEDELDRLISDISLYSNSQSKVSRVDLKSRNLELEKIKTLSKSVLPPNGNKWFFEKSRGEFNTMVKLSGGNKKKLEKAYPRSRRFSKEQLGKYYTAWGETPHLVKLGGEKVFRYFIEKISGDGEKKRPVLIDRDFYEDLISRIIIFGSLETLHGAGKNSLGQLRSAVVPYSISILYLIFNQKKSSIEFNFELVWKDQRLQEVLEIYLYNLMELMNSLIKKYSKSDDFGQYSKKEELWIDIRNSSEIKNWMKNEDTETIIRIYSRKSIKKKKNTKEEIINFDSLIYASELYSYGKEFFANLETKAGSSFSDSELRRFEKIKANFFPKSGQVKDVLDNDLKIVDVAIKRLKSENPELLESILKTKNNSCLNSTNQIIEIYNGCIENKKDLISEFSKHESIAQVKSYNYTGIIREIGKNLKSGRVPKLSEINLVKEYFNDREKKKLGIKKLSDTY